jgi:hypothetical protein
MAGVGYGEHEGLIGLGNILTQLDNYVCEAAERCANDLIETLERNTPIRTGRARQSWEVHTNTYTEGLKTGLPPYIGGVEIEMRTNKVKYLHMKSRQNKRRLGLTGFDLKKDTNIVVSSNIPYMARLNRGWSVQASPGWIERCIDEVTAKWGIA